jgi:glutathione synthase/RimK-type ligase-like ATP-grasp enzyme
MNHPSVNAACSHKLEQLSTALALGFAIPDTLLTQDAAELREFFARHGGQIITKPLARGYVERAAKEPDTLIYTNVVPPDHLFNLDDLAACPTLFQELIDKKCDVRITAVEGDLHAVELLAKDDEGRQRCDIRRNNMMDVAYRPIRIPDAIAGLLHRLLDHYALRFAAIDMVVSGKGEWYYLETNPNGQWAWLDLAGVTRIGESFVRAFRE